MYDLEHVLRALRDRNLRAVAKGVGIHSNTLYRLTARKTARPSYETVRRLAEYLAASGAPKSG